MKEMRNIFRILVRKPEGKIPLGTYKHMLEYNIKMDLKEVGCDNVH
jgi:hypothetical protein